jgi:uncharacterized protein (DUF2252 family)
MPSLQREMKMMIDQAQTHTKMQVLGKLTDIVDDKYRLRDNAPIIVHESHTQAGRPINEAISLWIESYLSSLTDNRKALLHHYRILDVARKVAGVGSVGTRCWIAFLAGENSKDPLFLQVKQAEASVLEAFLPKSVYKNHGERVVAGQRMIQGAPDILLGWGIQDGIHFYVRQLRDMKGGMEFEPGKVSTKDIPGYCDLCGWALALAHAKSGDAAMIAGYVGNKNELDDALVRFAVDYATQNNKDYKALVAAKKSGRIKAANGEN